MASNEGITIGALERAIGASKGVLSRAINNGTDIQAKWLQIIVENYPRYSADWLLSGKGDMLRNKEVVTQRKAEPALPVPENSHEGIPLIPLSAMAGAFTGETSVMEYECERYVIPAFKGADFHVSACRSMTCSSSGTKPTSSTPSRDRLSSGCGVDPMTNTSLSFPTILPMPLSNFRAHNSTAWHLYVVLYASNDNKIKIESH